MQVIYLLTPLIVQDDQEYSSLSLSISNYPDAEEDLLLEAAGFNNYYLGHIDIKFEKPILGKELKPIIDKYYFNKIITQADNSEDMIDKSIKLLEQDFGSHIKLRVKEHPNLLAVEKYLAEHGLLKTKQQNAAIQSIKNFGKGVGFFSSLTYHIVANSIQSIMPDNSSKTNTKSS